jgi:hypothetical protein
MASSGDDVDGDEEAAQKRSASRATGAEEKETETGAHDCSSATNGEAADDEGEHAADNLDNTLLLLPLLPLPSRRRPKARRVEKESITSK